MKRNCECYLCGNNIPCEIPEDLYSDLKSGGLVIFAGAGISTETKRVFVDTLYEDVLFDIEQDRDDMPFPDVMSKFCERPNGRKKLLQKIKHRFDYVHQFKSLYNVASDFHRNLSKLWMIDTIITTNWDDYFERECNAIPVVTNSDFAFFNLSERKVLKIHGSINNYGSVIATRKDYENSLNQLKEGIIGSVLKSILATKTVVFVGYSFRDFNFQQIFDFIHSELKDITPHFYLVTLDEKAEERLQDYNMSIIKTDGSYFIHQLALKLEEDDLKVKDEVFDFFEDIENLTRTIHHEYISKFDLTKYPALLFTHHFQDGLIHSFDYIRFRKKTGDAYHKYFIHKQISNYLKLHRQKKKDKIYHDVAYIDGFVLGLMMLVLPKEEFEKPPLFYYYGIGPIADKVEFDELLEESNDIHKTATRYAKRILKNYKNADQLVIQHSPFL